VKVVEVRALNIRS